MWIRTHSQLYTGIKKEDIWALWVNVNNWAKWHGDLDYCRMEGEFAVGNFFMLKPKGAPAVKIVLTDIKPGSEFTDCTHFFGAKMFDTHTITETEDGLILSNKLVVTGPLRWLWIKLVAKHVADTVPDEVEALVNLARKMNG